MTNLVRPVYQQSIPLVIFLACLSLSSIAAVAEEVEVTAEVAKLLASDGQASDDFGFSVSLDGDRLAIGARSSDDKGSDSGSVYVFERDADGGWSQVSKLLALDGEPFEWFGDSVSLDGDRVAIGAYKDDDNGTASGSAYVFERNVDGSWSEVGKLLALDGQAQDLFGESVSLDGDRVAIGAVQNSDSGSAYIFERDADAIWLEVGRLLPLDGQANDLFGNSVSLDGDRVAIGAPGNNDSGSAYVFERNAEGDWFEVSKLLALDGQAQDLFGNSVSLDGDRVAIGASVDDDNGTSSGSAYVFERDADGVWFEVSKLLSLDGQADDRFGHSVSLDGDRVVIGATKGDNDNLANSGSVYVFERGADGVWSEVSKLLALDGHVGDEFGTSVSLDGDRVSIGASEDENNGDESGSAYVFETVLVSPQLTLSGTCPGEVQLTSTGTTPRSGLRLYSSAAPGTWTFDSGPCEGAYLGLEMPTFVGQSTAGFDAERNRVSTVDASDCGTYLQVIDLKTCLTSNVVQVP